MLMFEDVQDDLREAFPEYYSIQNNVLVYQNGVDSPKYVVEIIVHEL